MTRVEIDVLLFLLTIAITIVTIDTITEIYAATTAGTAAIINPNAAYDKLIARTSNTWHTHLLVSVTGTHAHQTLLIKTHDK